MLTLVDKILFTEEWFPIAIAGARGADGAALMRYETEAVDLGAALVFSLDWSADILGAATTEDADYLHFGYWLSSTEEDDGTTSYKFRPVLRR